MSLQCLHASRRRAHALQREARCRVAIAATSLQASRTARASSALPGARACVCCGHCCALALLAQALARALRQRVCWLAKALRRMVPPLSGLAAAPPVQPYHPDAPVALHLAHHSVRHLEQGWQCCQLQARTHRQAADWNCHPLGLRLGARCRSCSQSHPVHRQLKRRLLQRAQAQSGIALAPLLLLAHLCLPAVQARCGQQWHCAVHAQR